MFPKRELILFYRVHLVIVCGYSMWHLLGKIEYINLLLFRKLTFSVAIVGNQ